MMENKDLEMMFMDNLDVIEKERAQKKNKLISDILKLIESAGLSAGQASGLPSDLQTAIDRCNDYQYSSMSF